MKLKMYREIFNETETHSSLYHQVNEDCDEEQEFLCFVLEDKTNEIFGKPKTFKKIPKLTAIPYGTYEIILDYSPKFRRILPRLLNVPYYQGILIHSGNVAADTDGCLIVGLKRGKNSVLDSKNALNGIIMPLLRKYYKKEKIFIEITKR